MFVRDPERDFTQTDEEAEESLEVGMPGVIPAHARYTCDLAGQ